MKNKPKQHLKHVSLGLTGLATLCSQLFWSQQTAQDSINLSSLEKTIRSENPSISFFQPLDFTETSFTYTHTQQNFKRVQSPETTQNYAFNSRGVFHINPKIILSGRLKAEQTNEKNVPYILTDDRTTDQFFIANPFYMWAPRAGNWTRQNYLFNGQIAYRPIQPIIAQLGAEGNFSKSYRGNADPRPQMDNYQYLIFSKLGFSIKKHSFFGKLSYTNKYRKNDIMFVNKNGNVPANDSIYIRYNEGYGNQYRESLFRDSEYKKSGYIAGGEYAFNTDKTHISAGYDYQNIIDRFYKNYEYKDATNITRRVFTKHGGLKTDLHKMYINFLGNYNGYRYASRLTYQDQLDTNYNYLLNYRTYRLEQQDANWQNSISWFNGRNENSTLYLDLGYGKNHMRDASVILDRRLTYFRYSIGAEREFVVGESQKIAVGIAQNLYLPLEKNFTYIPYESSKENIFVQHIASPDYAYDTTPQLGMNLRLSYRIDRDKLRYEIVGSYAQRWLAGNAYKTTVTDYNGQANSVASVGINVYY